MLHIQTFQELPLKSATPAFPHCVHHQTTSIRFGFLQVRSNRDRLDEKPLAQTPPPSCRTVYLQPWGIFACRPFCDSSALGGTGCRLSQLNVVSRGVATGMYQVPVASAAYLGNSIYSVGSGWKTRFNRAHERDEARRYSVRLAPRLKQDSNLR